VKQTPAEYGWMAVWGGVGLFLALSGCQTPRPGADPASLRAARELQQTVEGKIAEQRRPADGAERWSKYKADAYQDPADIARSTDDLRLERSRNKAAEALAAGGPIPLEQCLMFCLEFNDAIQARRAQLRSVGGDEIVNYSRFLPHLTYALKSQRMDRKAGTSAGVTTPAATTNATYQSLRVTQTLFEFGKDNALDVALRDSQRAALFDYEEAARQVLRDTRINFFTIMLLSQQLAGQTNSLANFQARYDIVSKLEQAQRALESDVLTARLNVLTVQSRINGLEKEILRRKFDLLHLLGFPAGRTDIRLTGTVEEFNLEMDQAVDCALRRSPDIAKSRAAVAEQARKVRETGWEYAPDLSLQAGWKDAKSMAGVDLTGADGLYTASTFAETFSDTYAGRFGDDLTLLDEDERGWFVSVALELPLFEGLEKRGRYGKEQGLLDQARHDLRAAIEGLELDIRKKYQTVLEQRQQVELTRETMEISRERLRVQERLKELGQVTDNEVETFRALYFAALDSFFAAQIHLVGAQENLRYAIRDFEPLEGANPNQEPKQP